MNWEELEKKALNNDQEWYKGKMFITNVGGVVFFIRRIHYASDIMIYSIIDNNSVEGEASFCDSMQYCSPFSALKNLEWSLKQMRERF